MNDADDAGERETLAKVNKELKEATEELTRLKKELESKEEQLAEAEELNNNLASQVSQTETQLVDALEEIEHLRA